MKTGHSLDFFELRRLFELDLGFVWYLGPKKSVNFYMFKKHQKCILYILTPNHLSSAISSATFLVLQLFGPPKCLWSGPQLSLCSPHNLFWWILAFWSRFNRDEVICDLVWRDMWRRWMPQSDAVTMFLQVRGRPCPGSAQQLLQCNSTSQTTQAVQIIIMSWGRKGKLRLYLYRDIMMMI